MNGMLTELVERFPVRNTEEQKEAFRGYVKNMFPGARAEKNGANNNLIVGDAEKAKVIFCAHYDTPRRALFPNLMLPANKALALLYSILVMLPLIAVAVVFVYALTRFTENGLAERLFILLAYFAVYFGLFFLIFRGPANRHNANDNTSGTAAVLRLAGMMQDGCAFILFDGEEKGKLGSRAFAKDHPGIKEKVPVINLDCVGNGSVFVFSASDAFLSSPLCASLRGELDKAGVPYELLDRKKSRMNSDHVNFSVSCGVCACRKNSRGILYTPCIHTKRDTVADEGNIDTLTRVLAAAAGNTKERE